MFFNDDIYVMQAEERGLLNFSKTVAKKAQIPQKSYFFAQNQDSEE